jgi:hypothetical protein
MDSFMFGIVRSRFLKRYVAFTFIIGLLLSIPVASAQWLSLEPLCQPVPEEWRAPYVQFLKATGVADVSKTISETKFGTIGRSNSALFRIEDNSSCIDDLCLTVVGHLDSEKFVSDAMVLAGPTIIGHDEIFPLLGFQNAVYEFRSEHGNVYLFEMRQGWIVIPFKK